MTPINDLPKPRIISDGDATGILPLPYGKPITVIANDAVRAGFDAACLQQAINAAGSPGVTQFVLNPDAHIGYGAPIGSVMVSPTHIYPGPVGVDIKCSMSLLQFNIPAEAVRDRRVRRALIEAITARLPTGAGRGQRSVKKGRRVGLELGTKAILEGATPEVLIGLGIPPGWATRCEDSAHPGHDGTVDALALRLEKHLAAGTVKHFDDKIGQLGSYGGGNHFGECEIVKVSPNASPKVVENFGLRDNHVAFLSHCGSRGLGNILAERQFRVLREFFEQWSIPLPANDRHLVYAPLGSAEANAYLDDLAIGANFATINHMLINALVLEAFQEVLPGTTGDLVYFISHNIARPEIVDNGISWVHRKGATRAFPAQHPGLKETPFYNTGHPILLPGNPREGSVVMVAAPGAVKSCFSVNHGAGRRMGRKDAARRLNQKDIDIELDKHDILSNCRQYPIDEAPDAYKAFGEVLDSVETAGLATTVATLKATFVIKDGDKADD